MPVKKITTVEMAAMRREFRRGNQSIENLRKKVMRRIAISTPHRVSGVQGFAEQCLGARAD